MILISYDGSPSASAQLLRLCNAGCPAGENIQACLAHVQAGEYERAWRGLVADNPLPAIHGRVCYDPSESVCNRAKLDSTVAVHAVERFLGDLALEHGWQFDAPPAPTGKRVLVIGAGPSGMSAACHLARQGHQVDIRDAGAEPGGMMRYGIPSFRLPRDVLDGELQRILELGVGVTCGHRVKDLVAERDEGGFDGVFIAVGAGMSKRVEIPGRDAGPVVDAWSFLRSVASGEPVIGGHVAVYGEGNRAMAAACVARRPGTTDIAFLRGVRGVEFNRDGTVQVSQSMMTGCAGVFAGGNVVPSQRTVTIGTRQGYHAARQIDAWLKHSGAPVHPSTVSRTLP